MREGKDARAGDGRGRGMLGGQVLLHGMSGSRTVVHATEAHQAGLAGITQGGIRSGDVSDREDEGVHAAGHSSLEADKVFRLEVPKRQFQAFHDFLELLDAEGFHGRAL